MSYKLYCVYKPDSLYDVQTNAYFTEWRLQMHFRLGF